MYPDLLAGSVIDVFEAFRCRAPKLARSSWGLLAGFLAFTVLLPAVPVAAAAPPDGAIRVIHDVQYGDDLGAPLKLDVYEPPGVSKSPGILFVHGGGFVAGDKDAHAREADALADAGFVVFVANYSLEPTSVFPRDVQEIRTALRWVSQHAQAYGADRRRLGLAGSSAGAYLVAMVGLDAVGGASPKVRAVVTLSAPFDLTTYPGLGVSTAACRGACGSVTQDPSLVHLLGCPSQRCSVDVLREASPVSYVGAKSPPFFIANSTAEFVPQQQATDMAAHLRAVGVPVHVVLVPGSRHATQYEDVVGAGIVNFLRTYVDVPVTSSAPSPWAAWWVWLLVVVCLVAMIVVGIWIRRWRAQRTESSYY